MNEIKFTKLLNGMWRAELGAFQGSGQFKRAAKKALFSQIADEPAIAKPYTLKTASGDVWVLYRQVGAWVYETPSGCAVMSSKSRDTAINDMVEHAYQYYG